MRDLPLDEPLLEVARAVLDRDPDHVLSSFTVTGGEFDCAFRGGASATAASVVSKRKVNVS